MVASRGERPRYTTIHTTIQAPRLQLELLEEDAELLAACATAAQTLLASVDKVRPHPVRTLSSNPSPSPNPSPNPP